MVKRYFPVLVVLTVVTACFAVIPERNQARADGMPSGPYSRLSIAVVVPAAGGPALTRARDYNRNLGVEVIDINRAVDDAAAVFERTFKRAVKVSGIEDAGSLSPDLVAVLEIRYSLPDGVDTDVKYDVSALIMTSGRRNIDTIRGSGTKSALGFFGMSGANRIGQAFDAAVREADMQMENQLQSSIRLVTSIASGTALPESQPQSVAPGQSASGQQGIPQPRAALPEAISPEPFSHLSVAVVVPDNASPALARALDYNRKAGIRVMNVGEILADAVAVFERNFKQVVTIDRIEDARSTATDLIVALEIRYSLPDTWDNDVSYDVSAEIMTPDQRSIDKLRGSSIRSPLSFFALSRVKRIGEAISAAAKEAHLQMEDELRASVRTAAFVGSHPLSTTAIASLSSATPVQAGGGPEQKKQAITEAQASLSQASKAVTPSALSTRTVKTVPGAAVSSGTAAPVGGKEAAQSASAREAATTRPHTAAQPVSMKGDIVLSQASTTKQAEQKTVLPEGGGLPRERGIPIPIRIIVLCVVVFAIGYFVYRRFRR
jgi:hypothetical protein